MPRTHSKSSPSFPVEGLPTGRFCPHTSPARRICLDSRSWQQQRHVARRDARLSEEHSIRRGAADGLSPTPFIPTSGAGGVALRTQIGATLAGRRHGARWARNGCPQNFGTAGLRKRCAFRATMFLSKGRCVSRSHEALSRVKIDALLRDAGRAFAEEARFALNSRCRMVPRPIAYSSTGPDSPWRCSKPSVSAPTPCPEGQENVG